ncbi:2-oxoacid:acceptor oxidoreductase family protein [Chloroflexota bacterium]
MKKTRYEMRIAGSGGQGIITAGIILAEAAVADGRHVAQSQNYGPEARGGISVSEAVISDVEIDYPWALQLDLLVALTQGGCDRNLPDMKAEGVVIVDSGLVHRVLWGRVISLPLGQIARKVGEERAINVAALGAIKAFCPRVSRRSLEKAITEKLPQVKARANLEAFEEAMKIASAMKSNLKVSARRRLRPVEAKEEFEI